MGTWHIERDYGSACLILRFKERLSRQDCVRATKTLLEARVGAGPHSVLVDVRNAVCGLGVGDIYAVPALWEHGHVHHGSALALLVTAASAHKRDVEFFETTCRNRGWNVRAFDDEAAALAWLASQVRSQDQSALG